MLVSTTALCWCLSAYFTLVYPSHWLPILYGRFVNDAKTSTHSTARESV